ncbi:hypothetical protein AB6A40_009627 [Gnathostoma spinigerum]|uniref:GDP-fucose protein O-fucosyltransferase 2 n=1 Tax=Gnathostoma spinigerum TaxID=75299 RepID=A0ABD6F097_9BILA
MFHPISPKRSIASVLVQMLLPPLLAYSLVLSLCVEVAASGHEDDKKTSDRKYFLYDVNHGEGFNLRRDVFMRIANCVRKLQEIGFNYILVLPPWGGMYHWDQPATKLPWSTFFDVRSINDFVPVIEFGEFLKETGNKAIDEVIYLQAYKEGWTDGKFELKYDIRDCINGDRYYHLEDGKWHGWFFSYPNLYARSFKCVSFQGDSGTLADYVAKNLSNHNSIFIDRAETALHEHFGDKYYWQARRSMRYANHLIEIGNRFRSEKLNSNDKDDRTVMLKNWKNDKKDYLKGRGGPYICVHWRRRDFIRAHPKEIPSIEGTARQLNRILEENNLTTIFLSSDASVDESKHLESLISFGSALVRFTARVEDNLTDGEIAVIDQWICSHARYFIGSYVSTFSYRIQEDREILGFHPSTTFNRLCPDQKSDCEQPARWKIVY